MISNGSVMVNKNLDELETSYTSLIKLDSKNLGDWD